MVLVDEMLVFTLSVAVLTLSVAHVAPEGFADMIVPVIVVAIFSSVVDG